jgi:hypothetical protein
LLLRGEDSLKEAVAVAVQGGGYAGDFNNINADGFH